MIIFPKQFRLFGVGKFHLLTTSCLGFSKCAVPQLVWIYKQTLTSASAASCLSVDYKFSLAWIFLLVQYQIYLASV